MAKKKKISLGEYAKLKGLDKETVARAARNGKISFVQSGQKKLVDPDIADREWLDNTDGSKTRPKEDDEDSEQETKGPSSGQTYAAARAAREAFAANLKQLEYEEKTKQLVKADDIKKAAFNCARIVRDQILGIPDRISHIVASETDPDKVYKTIQDALHQALEELSRGGDLD